MQNCKSTFNIFVLCMIPMPNGVNHNFIGSDSLSNVANSYNNRFGSGRVKTYRQMPSDWLIHLACLYKKGNASTYIDTINRKTHTNTQSQRRISERWREEEAMEKLPRAYVLLVSVIVVINCSWLGVNGELRRSGFPKDFIFGTASSAYQVIY